MERLLCCKFFTFFNIWCWCGRVLLQATGTNPCTDEVLFGHVRYLEQSVCERLFEHGKHIFVKTENDNERVARIEVCCKGKLFVSYLNIDDKERKEDVDGEITIDDVVTDAFEVDHSMKRVLAEEKDKRRKWDFLDVEEVTKYKDLMDHSLNDLIEVKCLFSTLRILIHFISGPYLIYLIWRGTAAQVDLF
ncbi:unnamed protein product [Cylicostephanus goldi]|uniref:Uncharacterized protein n=1 Tax=Cylicostephanus goldi TaxID=71465 RepID=A0A3P6S2F9_CYLGO|nr:unnamed protein product [Cylicostephanus goldi]